MVSHLPNGQIILRFAERSTINPVKFQFIRIRSVWDPAQNIETITQSSIIVFKTLSNLWQKLS